jgi:starch-binding outer membrane protein, SusD/RagB family
MKKIIILFILLGMSLVFPTSCLKEYLDKAPAQGLNEQEIFTKVDNFKKFFDAVYSGRKVYSGSYRDFNIKMAYQLYWDLWDQKYSIASVTDASDNGRYMEGHAWKSGNMSETIVNKMTYDGARNPVLESMITCIRISNIALRKVDRIQDADDAAKNDLRGQAYFIRAFSHMTLMNWWGPFPYLDYVIGTDATQWDLERLPKHEYLTKVAQDFDSSYICFKLAGKIRRDPPFGQPNHLNYGAWNGGGNEMYRPNGMAAKGFAARALLYRASPLNTEGDANDWKEAAAKSWEALQVAINDGGVFLLTPLTNRKLNFCGSMVTDEELFTYSFGNLNWDGGNQQGTDNRGVGATLFNGAFGAATNWSGVCPTQNFVDKYETKWGDPLNTDADRIAAAGLGHYNEQDPYTNRDPRFAEDVIYNQSPCLAYGSGADYGTATNTAQIFYWKDGTGAIKQAQLLTRATYPGMTYTGYYMRKFWWNNSTLNRVTGILTDPVMRLAELYLNYAEAANEAYGPNTPAPGASLTAVQAINVIRTRAGMPDVLPAYTGTKDAFRPRIKNERNIELSWEGHYYNDIHRWMDLQTIMSSTLIGMDIERLTLTPLVFKYTRLPLPPDRQPVWKPQMYYLPFNNADNLKMSKFVPNPVW